MSDLKMTSIIVGLLALASLVPIPIIHEKNGPKEDIQYIRRVWAENTVGQVFSHEYTLDGIRILAYAKQPQATTLEVFADDTVIAQQEILVTKTSDWYTVWFDVPLAPGNHTLTFRAPGLSAQDNAILMRYQVDSRFYKGGHMVVNGEESYGDIAFRTLEKAPAWRAIVEVGQITDKSSRRALVTLVIGCGMAAALFFGTHMQPSRRNIAIVISAHSAVCYRNTGAIYPSR
jgi:hypothetical protein